MQHTSPSRIAQVLGGGLGVDVGEVDHPVQRLVPAQATEAVHTVHTVHAIHSSEIRGEGQVGGHREPEIALTLDEREGSLSNKRLGSGLLRLEDIGTSILAVVSALPCPGGRRRELVGDLCSWTGEYHVDTK